MSAESREVSGRLGNRNVRITEPQLRHLPLQRRCPLRRSYGEATCCCGLSLGRPRTSRFNDPATMSFTLWRIEEVDGENPLKWLLQDLSEAGI